MKEIKAFIPIRRIAQVADALRNSGICDISAGKAECWNVMVNHVQRLVTAQDPGIQQYSVNLAELVMPEAKLELVCSDELADQLVSVIQTAARTARRSGGWIFVSSIERSVEIT